MIYCQHYSVIGVISDGWQKITLNLNWNKVFIFIVDFYYYIVKAHRDNLFYLKLVNQIEVVCEICSISIDRFQSWIIIILDKSNMVNDVSENDNFDWLNPVSSWRCGLWSSHNSSPYSLQVLEQSCYFQTRVIS